MTRPGLPRVLWTDIEAKDSAIARVLREHPDMFNRRRRGGGSSIKERLQHPEEHCLAAKPWPWGNQIEPTEGWLPCTFRVSEGERYCYRHGGPSRDESRRRRHVLKAESNKVNIEIRFGCVTLADLPAVASTVEKHASAANAPTTARVTFEDPLVRGRGEGDLLVVRVQWELD